MNPASLRANSKYRKPGDIIDMMAVVTSVLGNPARMQIGIAIHSCLRDSLKKSATFPTHDEEGLDDGDVA
jgi:hypothetical protein